jgi:hypothetical protein
VVGKRGLADVHLLEQNAGAFLSAPKHRQYLQPFFIAQCLENPGVILMRICHPITSNPIYSMDHIMCVKSNFVNTFFHAETTQAVSLRSHKKTSLQLCIGGRVLQVPIQETAGFSIRTTNYLNRLNAATNHIPPAIQEVSYVPTVRHHGSAPAADHTAGWPWTGKSHTGYD